MSYPPPYYTENDPAFARRIMAQHPFGLLVSDGLEATHLPLLYREEPDGSALLEGHLSRKNPMAARLSSQANEGLSALAVFSGPHGYVSAALYDNPNGSVPTWNYTSVQVRGTLHPLPDAFSLHHLQNLAKTFEGPDGWSVSRAPDYVATLQKGIIAFQMRIEALQAFRKMSGNKPYAIQKRIIDAASQAGENAFAEEMIRSLPKKDNK